MKVLITCVVTISALLNACGGDDTAGASYESQGVFTQPTVTACDSISPNTAIQYGVREAPQLFLSQLTGIEYQVDVYLPESYDSTELLPVIYATDGQWVARRFSAAIDRARLPIILVAIHQGPENRRWEDYTLPGADQYIQFLLTELLPSMENQYRIDPSRRTLQGASLGGLLTLFVMLQDDEVNPVFENIISMDPSVWYQPAFLNSREASRFNQSLNMPVELVLSSATGYQGNLRNVEPFKNRLEMRGYENFYLHYAAFDVCHDDIAGPAFDHALNILF